jgi:hypothetical protein
MSARGETLWTVQSVYNTKKTSKYDGLYWSLEVRECIFSRTPCPLIDYTYQGDI